MPEVDDKNCVNTVSKLLWLESEGSRFLTLDEIDVFTRRVQGSTIPKDLCERHSMMSEKKLQ